MKRLLDIFVSVLGLACALPLLLPMAILVYRQDGHSPFYIAPRMGKGGIPFKMVKLRSMVIHADRSGVDSTAGGDPRITPVGHFIRRYKLDELTQLWNVVLGDMSLVGPRPNVKRETDLYTAEEKQLLAVRPGITDIASIVFADEGEILKNKDDPDLAYNQLIRPWKSRLGILYVQKRSLGLDIRLLWLTALTLISRERALTGVVKLLKVLDADNLLIRMSARQEPLLAYPPPGADAVVSSRG